MENINDDIKELYVGYVVEPAKGCDFFRADAHQNSMFFNPPKWFCEFKDLPYDKECRGLDKKKIKYTILFEKTDHFTVKEALTGVEFGFLYNKLIHDKDLWDRYVKVVDHPNCAVPEKFTHEASNYEIEEYIRKHKDVNKYREELLAYKDNRDSIRKSVLNQMEQEMLDKQRAREEEKNIRQSLFNKIIDMRKAYSVKNNDITM